MILVDKKIKRFIKSALYSAFFTLALPILFSCDAKTGPLVLKGPTMGTRYQVTIVDPVLESEATRAVVSRALEDINQKMSTYLQTSELSLINQAELDTWLPVSEDLAEVLSLSQTISAQSGGSFDVTVGPLVNLWGFGPDKTANQLPEPELIEKALANTGAGSFEIDASASAIKKLKPVYIDLSAIAKGYAADKLAALLSSMGYRNFLVEIGGELRVFGKNSRGLAWRLAIEKPELLPGDVYEAIAVTDSGVATSGDYRNFFEVNGVRYSHTINPLTGLPINHTLASVTVIAKTAAAADAWATALNVLGTRKGLALAEQLGLAAYFITDKDGEFVAQYSQEFSSYLD